MTSPRSPKSLEPGAVIRGRYKVLQVIEHDVWGSTCVVDDTSDPGLRLVLKQIFVPPLRKELDLRLDLFGEALKRLHQMRHPSVAPVVDFFNDDGILYVVMEGVPGTDLETALASGKAPRDTRDIVSTGLHVARGLEALLAAGQYQAVTAFSPKHVVLAGTDRAALVSYGVGHFLRPFGMPWRRPDTPSAPDEGQAFEAEFQRQAVRRIGQLLYVLVTGQTWSDTVVLTAGGLPEDVGPVLLRCLRSGADGGYDDLAAVIRDLSLLYNVQGLADWQWTVSQTPLPPPPWEKMGVGAFAWRSSLLGLRHLYGRFREQTWFTRAAILLLVASLLTWWVVDASAPKPLPYQKEGAVVYVGCKSGDLQIWDARTYRCLASRRFEAACGPVAWSKEARCVLVGLPTRNRIAAYNLQDNVEQRSIMVQTGCSEMVVSPEGRYGFCTGATSGLLGGFDLRKMRGTRVLSLPGPCAAMASGKGGRSLVVATDGPAALQVFETTGGTVSGHVALDEVPRRIRVRPDGSEYWLIGATAVTVWDAALTTSRRVEVGEGRPVDVGFDGDTPYLLWQATDDDRGNISRVEGAEIDPNSTVTVGRRPEVLLMLPNQIAWVTLPERRAIQVVDLPARRLKKNLELDAAPTALQWIP